MMDTVFCTIDKQMDWTNGGTSSLSSPIHVYTVHTLYPGMPVSCPLIRLDHSPNQVHSNQTKSTVPSHEISQDKKKKEKKDPDLLGFGFGFGPGPGNEYAVQL